MARKKSTTRKTATARKPAARKPRAPRIKVFEVDDEVHAAAYGGAWVAEAGDLTSAVRSTPERAEAELERLIAEQA